MQTALMDENYKAMQAKALEQFMKGQSLSGKGGAFRSACIGFMRLRSLTAILNSNSTSNQKDNQS